MFHLILNYHAVNQEDVVHHDDDIYAVRYDSFKQQLALIHTLKCRVVLLDEPILAEQNPSISLTFDDGHASDTLLVLPLLEEYGFKASFFVPAESLQNNVHKRNECLQLIASGHYVGPHGYAHTYYNTLSPKMQYREMLKAREVFKKQLNVVPTIFALPGGKYNQATVKLAQRAGYQRLLGTGYRTYPPGNSKFMHSRWTIKNHTSFERFSGVLQQRWRSIYAEQVKARIKSGLHLLLSNEVAIKLNYVLRKWMFTL